MWLLVGKGRLGSALFNALRSFGESVSAVSRNQSAAEITSLIECSDRVLLALPDREITPFLDQFHTCKRETIWIHFAATRSDPRAERAHPLYSFSGREISPEEFARIPFILDRGARSFAELFPKFSNPNVRLANSDRDFYHALCVLGAALPLLIWADVEKAMQRELAIPADFWRRYTEGIAKNFLEMGRAALTGPWVRSDLETIQKNSDALLNRSPQLAAFYAMGLKQFYESASERKSESRANDLA